MNEITVNDLMQQGYRYRLEAPLGNHFDFSDARLALAFPFVVELIEKLLHKGMSLLCQFLAMLRKHETLQQKQLFVKMADGGTFAVFIRLKTGV